MPQYAVGEPATPVRLRAYGEFPNEHDTWATSQRFDSPSQARAWLESEDGPDARRRWWQRVRLYSVCRIGAGDRLEPLTEAEFGEAYPHLTYPK